MSPPIFLIAHPSLTRRLSIDRCPAVNRPVSQASEVKSLRAGIGQTSADYRPISVRTLVTNQPMSDRYASMHDRCMTDVIDIGRTSAGYRSVITDSSGTLYCPPILDTSLKHRPMSGRESTGVPSIVRNWQCRVGQYIFTKEIAIGKFTGRLSPRHRTMSYQ